MLIFVSLTTFYRWHSSRNHPSQHSHWKQAFALKTSVTSFTISFLSHFSKKRISDFGHIESHREPKQRHANANPVDGCIRFRLLQHCLVVDRHVTPRGHMMRRYPMLVWRWNSFDFVGQKFNLNNETRLGKLRCNQNASSWHSFSVWISLGLKSPAKRSYLTFCVCSIWTWAGEHVVEWYCTFDSITEYYNIWMKLLWMSGESKWSKTELVANTHTHTHQIVGHSSPPAYLIHHACNMHVELAHRRMESAKSFMIKLWRADSWEWKFLYEEEYINMMRTGAVSGICLASPLPGITRISISDELNSSWKTGINQFSNRIIWAKLL